MATIPLCDKAGKPVRDVELPDDVLEAAYKVRAWMLNNQALRLCGLVLDSKP